MELRSKKYTGREKTSKSLTLELVPCGDTARVISENRLLEADMHLYEIAEKLKIPYDAAIKAIAVRAIESISFDFEEMYAAYCAQKSGENSDGYKNCKKKLLDTINEQVGGALPGNIRKVADLDSAGFLYDVLPNMVKDSKSLDKEIKSEFCDIMESESGFAPLMSQFATSRITALETWIPERVVENVEIYFDNIPLIKPFLETPEGAAFCEEFEEVRDFTAADYYRFCMTAEGINAYNRVISGESNEDGIVRKGYNSVINEKNMKTKADKAGGAYYRKIKPLNQQIFELKPKMFVIESITCDDDLRKLLTETSESLSQKIVYGFTSIIKKSGPEKLLIKGNDVHEFSHVTTGKHSLISEQLYNQEKYAIDDAIEEAQRAKDKKKVKELTRKLEVITQTINARTYSIRALEMLSGYSDLFDNYIDRLRLVESKIAEKWATIVKGHLLQTARIYKKDSATILVKEYYDAINEYSGLIRLVSRCSSDNNADVEAYNQIDDVSECLRKANKAYNMIRNYLTRSPEDMVNKQQLVFGATANFGGKWWSGDKAGVGVNLLYRDSTDTPKYYFAVSPVTSPARSFVIPLAVPGEEYVQIH